MLKKPEWIDGVIERIESEVIRADHMQKQYMSLKRIGKATTQDYVNILNTVENFYKGSRMSNSVEQGMGYQSLAASSWHGRHAIKSMQRRLKSANGIDTEAVIEFRDMTAAIKKSKIETLRKEALALILNSHPHMDYTGENQYDVNGKKKKISPEAQSAVQRIQRWRISQLTALLESEYRKPLQAELPTAEYLFNKINKEQERVLNADYNEYLKAMETFNEKKFVPYANKKDSATYAEYEAVLYSLFGVFFAKLIRYYENTIEYPEFSDRNSSLAYGIITYIQENYRDITLGRVAGKFHYTPEYTSKFIKQTSGKTFSELLTQIRLEQAAKLLKNTALSVGDISYDIGYENPETFIRNFKKVYKKTPAVYRRESSVKTL